MPDGERRGADDGCRAVASEKRGSRLRRRRLGHPPLLTVTRPSAVSPSARAEFFLSRKKNGSQVSLRLQLANDQAVDARWAISERHDKFQRTAERGSPSFFFWSLAGIDGEALANPMEGHNYIGLYSYSYGAPNGGP